MKKSFKKAGAAVLSMAMLLSMGAISLPVYAAPDTYGNETGTGKPATVTVKINGITPNVYLQGEGARDDMTNGDGSDTNAQTKKPGYSPKYDYWTLDKDTNGLENATVTMYRIAQLTNNAGWQWEDFVNDYKGNKEDLVNFVDFVDLMKNKDGSGGNSSVTGEKEFNTSSDTLQQMASWFERAIESLKTDATQTANTSVQATAQNTLRDITVATRTFDNAAAINGVDLIVTDVAQLDVNHDGVVDEDEMARTQNVIGYYIIVTETDQSGAVVQPVLVCLKNGEHKVLTIKGTSVEFEKKMTGIHSTDEDADKGSDRYLATQKSGLVEQDDVVNFQIVSKLPKYDPNVRSGDITNFTITDTASKGLYLDILDETTGEIDPDKFEVYLVKSKTDAISAGWKLQGDTVENVGDYKLTVDNEVTTTPTHGFTLEISGYQMRESDYRGNGKSGTNTTRGADASDGYVDDVPLISYAGSGSLAAAPTDGTAGAMDKATRLNETDYNKGQLDSMEGMYIIINYQAKVNRTAAGAEITDESQLAFDRSFTDYIDLTGVTATMVEAVGEVPASRSDGYTALDDLKKQVARVQLVNGETRYNKQYVPADYAAGAAKFAALDADQQTALATAVTNALNTMGADPVLVVNDVKTAMFEAAGSDTDEGTFYRILALLALDKYNLTLNGENNTANMTYGNRYATGGGVGQLNTDYSKVYSTNFELSKFIELDNLEGIPAIQANTTAYGVFAEPYVYDATNNPNPKTITIPTSSTDDTPITFTLAEYQAAVDAATPTAEQEAILDAVADYVGSTPAVTADATGVNGYGVNPVTGEEVSPADVSALTVEDTDKADIYTTLSTEQQKLIAAMVNAENAARTSEGNQYRTINEKQAVVGAVFHLVRTYKDENNDDQTIDMGYAVSGHDGQLYKLTIPTIANGSDKGKEYTADAEFSEWPTGVNPATQPANTATYYFKGDDGKYRVGYVQRNNAGEFSGDTTWDMVDVGTYTVSELLVPTGYKKWANPITFTISAEQDTVPNYLAQNAFTGEFGATAPITNDPNAISSSGFGSIAETKAGNSVTFAYDTATGTLSHEMYNEYLDQLPATGGMGTVLFTAGGISVILVAGALFVMYMKKRNNEEEE